jgi:DNA-binding transcriptional regulator LsrR (DeoR family)
MMMMMEMMISSPRHRTKQHIGRLLDHQYHIVHPDRYEEDLCRSRLAIQHGIRQQFVQVLLAPQGENGTVTVHRQRNPHEDFLQCDYI